MAVPCSTFARDGLGNSSRDTQNKWRERVVWRMLKEEECGRCKGKEAMGAKGQAADGQLELDMNIYPIYPMPSAEGHWLSTYVSDGTPSREGRKSRETTASGNGKRVRRSCDQLLSLSGWDICPMSPKIASGRRAFEVLSASRIWLPGSIRGSSPAPT